MKPLKELYFPLVNIDVKKYEHQPVNKADFDTVIRQSCKVNLEGNQPIVYIAEPGVAMDELLPHLQQLKFSPSQRSGLGRNNKSILFGAVPASINKSNYCTYGAVANHDDFLHQLLTNKYSTYLQLVMERFLPGWTKVWNKLYERKNIHEDYRMAYTIWTSGIINLNSPQNYHYDDMNVSNMISAMITFKDGVEGGYLCFPEYRIAFEVKNQSVIFFSGKHILHGVTPMALDKNGHRISVVYYTTASLKKCDSYEHEIKKAISK